MTKKIIVKRTSPDPHPQVTKKSVRVPRRLVSGIRGNNGTLGEQETGAGLRHYYKPYGVAGTLFVSKQSEILVSGPAGTGKSRACMEKLHIAALKYPGMRGLIVRKTLTSLTFSLLVDWRANVIPEALENGTVRWYGGSAQESAQYIYSNGSVITIGGMDKATRIMSSQYDMIYVGEATELSVTDWEHLTTRLRNGKMPYQQIIADCNPDTPSHWIFSRFTSGDESRLMLESRHEDNPRLFKNGELTEEGKTYLKVLDALTGVRKERLRYGRWSASEGIIYEEWSPNIHVIDRFEIPSDWQRFWVVDFGYTNPFVLQRWAQDPDGRLYLYAEQYMTGRLVEDHAKNVLALVKNGDDWKEPKPRAVICDHDAEGRATLEKHLGLPTRAAYKNVSDGVEAVQVRLRVAGDGKPRLFILRDSLVEVDQSLLDSSKPTHTAQEIPGYVWDQSGKTPKEAPLKKDDHGCDCIRYLVAEIDRVGRANLRWL